MGRPSLVSFVFDETGKGSSARLGFWLTLVVTLRIVWLAAHGRAELSEITATLLTTLLIALIAWAAGPRIGAPLIAQIGAVSRRLRGRKEEIHDHPDAG
jgi:hypothetical protein